MSGPTGKSDFIKTVWGVGYKLKNKYRKIKIKYFVADCFRDSAHEFW